MQNISRNMHSRPVYGFSLIELMVSITIGLVIAGAAISAYLGAAGASRIADAQSRMNEDAQAALNLLTQQIRMAGANPTQANRATDYWKNPVFSATYVGGTSTSTSYTTTTVPTYSPTTYTTSGFAIRGCDGTFSNITATSATMLDNLTCASSTTTLPDSIAVSYEADRYNTPPTSAGLATDCAGSGLSSVSGTFPSGTATTATWSVADNRFYVASSASGVPSLYCKGIKSATQPLVENVEDMQLAYGTVSTTNSSATATVAGYLTADQVVTETNMALLTNDAARWGRVLAIRICIVVRSDTPVVSDVAASSYYKCDGSLDTSKTDLRLRRAYTTTVVMRNRRI